MRLRGVNDLRSLQDINTVLTVRAGSLPGSGIRISKLQRLSSRVRRIFRREEQLKRRKHIILQRLGWVSRVAADLDRKEKELQQELAGVISEQLALEREFKNLAGMV
ncbi:hypothetical protein [Calderihabitans maritimus]|uniref:Uncharacterized protein n=1 Tax=Calderihabitans maritimus TaxID=1246530 RepID=A0A1Z5HX25_9FIRM|nr:hypothetical protein [Calderihabitans maritimus]GAW93968.1 hypothetical protein Daud_1493 [Calderihabitans maritimus]